MVPCYLLVLICLVDQMFRCNDPMCEESAPFHTSSNMPALRCGCGENVNLFKVSSIKVE